MNYENTQDVHSDILHTIGQLKYTIRPQIRRLHFPDHKSDTPMKRCVKRLIDHDLVKEFTVPQIREKVLYLSKKGIECLTKEEIAPTQVFHTPKGPTIKHDLAIREAFISMKLQTNKNTFLLKTFEVDNHNRGIQLTVGNFKHVPDAVFTVSKESKTFLRFLEIDMATENNKSQKESLKVDITKMFKFYEEYAKFLSQTGKCNFGDFKTFRMVFITISDKRIDNIRSMISLVLDSRVLPQFFITHIRNIDKLHEPVLQSINVNDEKLYSIV